MEFTQIISPKQDPSDLPYPLPLVPTSTPCFVPINIPSNGPSTIPSTGSPNIIFSSVPYVLPNHSPSLTYLLPPFINDTVFLPPNYHQFHLQNNYMNTQVLTPSHPQYWVHLQLQLHLSQNPIAHSSKINYTQHPNLQHYYFTPLTHLLFKIIYSSTLPLI